MGKKLYIKKTKIFSVYRWIGFFLQRSTAAHHHPVNQEIYEFLKASLDRK